MITGYSQPDLIETASPSPPAAVGIRILPGLSPRVVMHRRLAALKALDRHEDQGRIMSDTDRSELEWLREYLARPEAAARRAAA